MGKKKKYKIRDSIKTIDLEEVREYISSHPEGKIFFGCDSQKYRKHGEGWARFISAVVITERNCNKIFGDITYERDFDRDPGKPQLRMMTEVYKISALINELTDLLQDRYFEVHLDVNMLEQWGSNCALQQAVGYIKGVHGVDPFVKSDYLNKHPWAASSVADHLLKH